ncbi:MAG: hypothetical protein FD123_2795 [Bacteroidetes bacterium]|nr:MAG: hypothetical protein FD123_2795 [Bacteroidota bacterium]
MKKIFLPAAVLLAANSFAQNQQQFIQNDDDNPPVQMATNISQMSSYGNIAPVMVNISNFSDIQSRGDVNRGNTSNVSNLVNRGNVSRGGNKSRGGDRGNISNPLDNQFASNDNNFEQMINLDNVGDRGMSAPRQLSIEVQAPQVSIGVPQINRPEINLPKVNMSFERKASSGGSGSHKKSHSFSMKRGWKSFKRDFRVKYRKMTRKRGSGRYAVADCCHFFGK